MIDGVLLGFLTWCSMLFTFTHLPNFLKRFMLNHFIFTDIICIAITFFALSSISQSITSVIGCIVCGLLVNITLVAVKQVGVKNQPQATE